MQVAASCVRPARAAVLLVNLGSPKAPTPSALRAYLAEFLSDSRVIDLPRWQWWPILHGIILRTRPKQSAEMYQKVWQDAGSPLVLTTQKQVAALQLKLAENGRGQVLVDYAMRYGEPSIRSRLRVLQEQGVTQLLCVPMYPQYGDATTASIIDSVAQAFRTQRNLPDFRFVHHWHDHSKYIAALAKTYEDYAREQGRPQALIISFHGIPKRYVKEGDSYFLNCLETATLLAQAIELPKEDIRVVFQSQFGREEWLKPYADEIIPALPHQGITHVAVMCPGFSADCLETLEEMMLRNQESFIGAGGVRYDYISALNDSTEHITLLYDLVCQHTQDWSLFSPGTTLDTKATEIAKRRLIEWRDDGVIRL